MSTRQRVVQLSQRSNYRPNLAQLARQQVASARRALDVTAPEFAALLAPLLDWEITPELVEAWETKATPPGDVIVAANLLFQEASSGTHNDAMDMVSRLVGDRFADLVGVFATRSEFTSQISPTELFDQAEHIDAVGLSLNLICQQYPDRNLRNVVQRGATLRLLFIDPAGDAVRRYEAEEGYLPGQIAALTELNIQTVVQRVRDQVPAELRDHVEIATYDETARFNLILVDRTTCIMQPYVPRVRGVDSPTFVVERESSTTGLFPSFGQVFSALWDGARRL